MTLSKRDLSKLKASADQAAALLRSLGNERRLLILCTLIGAGESSAGDLAAAVELSPSAASQHLARMREEGLVETRREAQSVLYRIADPNLERLVALLKDIYCS
jgi:ArsR family transcriptional regulator, virulence genes transcriptional regulator